MLLSFLYFFFFFSEMRVMVKETRKFSSDFQYPERAKKNNAGSAHIRLSKELFAKYKGEPSS